MHFPESCSGSARIISVLIKRPCHLAHVPWWLEVICIYCFAHVNHSNFRKKELQTSKKFIWTHFSNSALIYPFLSGSQMSYQNYFLQPKWPFLGPIGFCELLNFISSRAYFFLMPIVQDNVFLILHAEFQRFIIAYDILMSTVTFHWSYPTVINSSLRYKRRQSLSKCRKMQTVPQTHE